MTEQKNLLGNKARPKMIIFDYGHTLLYEPGFNSLRGEEALFKYIKTNEVLSGIGLR